MSLFSLIESKEGLASANMGASNATWLKVPCSTQATGSSFAGNVQEFRFSTSGQRWWVPSRSYFRIRASLRMLTAGANPRPPLLQDQIAPAPGFAANLYQYAMYRAADQQVSFVPELLSQVDAIRTRTSKSQAWLDSVGAGTNFWQASFDERQHAVAKDGRGAATIVPFPDQETKTVLGFAGATTYAYDELTGTVTIVGAEDLNDFFRPGDGFTWSARAAGGPANLLTSRQVLSVAVAPGLSMIVSRRDGDTAIAADAANDFFRTRSLPQEEKLDSADFEVVWQPPLSIFDVQHAIPSGEHRISLQPQTASAYQLRGIEIPPGRAVPTPFTAAGVGDFSLTINDIQFFAHVIDGPRVDDATYLLDLNNIQAHAQTLQSNNYSSVDFQVPASTRGLTVAFQAGNAGEGNPLIPASRFTIQSATVPTGIEKSLTRFAVAYAGYNKPSPDADPVAVEALGVANNSANSSLNLVNLWSDSLMYSGGFNDTGGAERIQDWLRRGLFVYQAWPKDGNDASTRAVVYTQFSTAFGAAQNNQVLLFAHNLGSARITVQNGQIIRVEPSDM